MCTHLRLYFSALACYVSAANLPGREMVRDFRVSAVEVVQLAGVGRPRQTLAGVLFKHASATFNAEDFGIVLAQVWENAVRHYCSCA